MIAASVIQTLRYSDYFGFPLNQSEINSRIISSKSIPLEQISKTLKLMIENNLIKKSGEFYYLPGSKKIIARRRLRELLSAPQLVLAKQISNKLSQITGVIAIYLTGSLAMSNSDNNADIDLMIIADNNHLWVTRALLTFYTELLGLRRRPRDSSLPGKVCLNLYLTPKAFEIPHLKQNLYTAYELIQAVPLYDPKDTHSSLLAANSWIHQYLPNYPLPTQSLRPLQEHRKTGLLEYLFYHLQLLYMRGKITREYVTRDSAFFHPNDPGAAVLKKVKV